MRTTITFAQDVAATVERFRRDHGVGVSAAVNALVRAGLNQDRSRPTFVQRTSAGGARIDVSNVGETLELLEGSAAK